MVGNIIHQLYTPQLQLSNGLYSTVNRDEELQQFKTKSSKVIRFLLVILVVYDAVICNICMQ